MEKNDNVIHLFGSTGEQPVEPLVSPGLVLIYMSLDSDPGLPKSQNLNQLLGEFDPRNTGN